MAGQLALDLSFPPRFGSDDFLVTDANRAAFELIMSWPDWPGTALLLVGPPGSGKTHLASIWAERAGAPLADGRLPAGPTSVLPTAGPAALDNIDAISGAAAEAALFHTLNLAKEHGRSILLTGSSPPDAWRLRTPDLLSRLRAAPMIELAAPDDSLVRAVLIKLFVDRQLDVDSAVIDYIALRMERSIGEARRLVARLDQASLEAGRRITRAVAAAVLAQSDA